MSDLENRQPSFETNDNTPEDDSHGLLQTVGSFIWELIKVFLLALVVIVPLRVFIAEPFIVSGSSMVPNFHHKEYLVIDKLSYKLHPPQRGDVIVLKYPKDTTQFFIKRIIGLPGEKIQLEGGHIVLTNSQHPAGVVIPEPYLPNQSITFGKIEPVELGNGEYYAFGDNRLASSDSRVWGILPQSDIVGKVWLRVFPPSNFGFIKSPEYKF